MMLGLSKNFEISNNIKIIISSISVVLIICTFLTYSYIEICKYKYLNVNHNSLSKKEKQNIRKVYDFLFKNKAFFNRTKYLSPSTLFSKPLKENNINLNNSSKNNQKK